MSTDLSDRKITVLRHCFLGHAKEISSEGKTNVVKFLDTKGYGWYGGRLNKEGVANPEGDHISGKYVACIPVITKNDLPMNSAIEGSTKLTQMRYVWADILQIMDDHAEKNEYNLVSHTCCTAAYRTIETILGKPEAKNRIKPDSFQLCGLGMIYGEWIGSVAVGSYGSLVSTIKIVKHIPENVKEFFNTYFNNLDSESKNNKEPSKAEHEL